MGQEEAPVPTTEIDENQDKHSRLVDALIVGASVFSVTGVASGYCQQKSRVLGCLGGAVAGAGITFFGYLMGAEIPYDYPQVRSRELDDIRSLGLVDVQLENEDWIRGRLSETDGEWTVLEAQGRDRAIPLANVRRIEKRGDPVWDTPLFAAGIGAGWGLLMTRTCSEGDPVLRAPSGRMVAWGAGLMGATALTLDLVRKGREVVWWADHSKSNEARSRTPHSGRELVVGPTVTRQGVGVAVSFWF